jgi:hypothetical protein
LKHSPDLKLKRNILEFLDDDLRERLPREVTPLTGDEVTAEKSYRLEPGQGGGAPATSQSARRPVDPPTSSLPVDWDRRRRRTG